MNQTLSKNKVLVIDDMASIRMIMEIYLLQLGIGAKLCSSGEQALEILANDQSFAAIFLDLTLTGISGEQFIARYRLESLSSPNPPIFAMTAEDTAEARQRLLACGCHDFLIKPVSRQQIQKSLEALAIIQHQAQPNGQEHSIKIESHYELIDAARLLDDFSMRIPYLIKIIDRFLLEWQQKLAELNHSLESYDSPAALKQIHNLLGNLRYFYCPLSVDLATMEKELTQHGICRDIKQQLISMEPSIARAQRELHQLRQELIDNDPHALRRA